jgi:hypothetical protein
MPIRSAHTTTSWGFTFSRRPSKSNGYNPTWRRRSPQRRRSCKPFDKVRLAGQPEKRRTFNGSSKLCDGQRGSRRLRSAWIAWGRLKRRPAFTPKRKSKNWPNGGFGSTSLRLPRSGIGSNEENGSPRFREPSKVAPSQRTSPEALPYLVRQRANHADKIGRPYRYPIGDP